MTMIARDSAPLFGDHSVPLKLEPHLVLRRISKLADVTVEDLSQPDYMLSIRSVHGVNGSQCTLSVSPRVESRVHALEK